jgi:hypothetical protein
MGKKALKIGDAAEDGQIFKLVSESRKHSKHRPMLQFETLLRLPALLRQQSFYVFTQVLHLEFRN